MVLTKETKATQIRNRLDHPIIDGDGHIMEIGSVYNDYIAKVGGSDMVKRFVRYFAGPRDGAWTDHYRSVGWEHMTMQGRKESWVPAPVWWMSPTENTLDRMTSHLPKLMAERLDDMGIDFAVFYASIGEIIVGTPGIADDELRRVAARAYNMYVADLYGEFSDRLTCAAVVPMHTPEEAIEELEFAVSLGLKAVELPGYVLRPVTQRSDAQYRQMPYYVDRLAIDSDYDYDPFWAKLVELKVAPGFHSHLPGPWRVSPSSFMYNDVGEFSEAHYYTSRALFMGGVTRRFPTLNFAFLEGGVGIGCLLLSQMLEFWEKRNAKTIQSLDPSKLDTELAARLFDEYASGPIAAKRSEFLAGLTAQATADRTYDPRKHLESLDDWHRAGIDPDNPREFAELFVRPFYWGCEADDKTTAWAFDTKVNPFGVKHRAILSSDISHCDVDDMLNVVPNTYKMLDRGLLSDEDFRDFAYRNVARLYAEMNPDFFRGTRVEAEVEKAMNVAG